MTSVLVCDHCRTELPGDDAVRVSVDLSTGALKAWLKAERLDPPLIRLDLHMECYARTLALPVNAVLVTKRGGQQ